MARQEPGEGLVATSFTRTEEAGLLIDDMTLEELAARGLELILGDRQADIIRLQDAVDAHEGQYVDYGADDREEYELRLRAMRLRLGRLRDGLAEFMASKAPVLDGTADVAELQFYAQQYRAHVLMTALREQSQLDEGE